MWKYRTLALAFLCLPALGEIKVLKNFTLIDGTGNAAIANAAMVIDNGRIARIGPPKD